MKDILLTSGDLEIADHTLGFVSGVDRVVQSMQIRLRTFLGEYFLDTNKGVPYFEAIFVKNPDLNQIDSILKSIILDDSEVTEIISYNSTFNNSQRAFSLSFVVATIYGNAQVEI